MYPRRTPILCLCGLLAACSLTQQPVSVSDSQPAVPVATATLAPTPVPSIKPQEPRPQPAVNVAKTPPAGQAPSGGQVTSLSLADLPSMARALRKNPQAVKTYSGQKLHGQARFVKTAKGNPNAVVADVRVTGLGEVSLWCRNVLGAVPTGRVGTFEGTLTASIYTSEDFSHDVFLKDCRFAD